MSKVEELKSAIESLPEEQYVKLRQQFAKKDWQKWDDKIEEDSKSGKLDFLIIEAFDQKKTGDLRDI